MFYTPLIKIIAIISLIIAISTVIPTTDGRNLTEIDIYNIFNNLSLNSMEGDYYTTRPSTTSSPMQDKLFQFFSRKTGTTELKLLFLKSKSVVMNFIIAEGEFRNKFASMTQTINIKDFISAYTDDDLDHHLYMPSKKTTSYVKQFRAILLQKSYKQEYIAITFHILNSQQVIKATIEIESIVSNEKQSKLMTEFTIEFELFIDKMKSKAPHRIYIILYILNNLFHLFTICYMIYLVHSHQLNLKGVSFLFIHIDMIWNAIQCIFISNISSYLEFNTEAYGIVGILHFIIFCFPQSYLVYLMRKTQEATCKELVRLFIFEFFASIYIFLYSFYHTFWKYLVHLIFPTTFLPQIFYNVTHRIKKRELPIIAVISFAMNKLFLLVYCMLIPNNTFKIKPEIFPGAYGIGIHIAQIIFLFIQWNYGYDFYLPRSKKNSIERYYQTYQEALVNHPNILKDRCSICLAELIIITPGDNEKIIKKAHKSKEKEQPQVIQSQSQTYKEKIIGKEYDNVCCNVRELENKLDTCADISNPNINISSSSNVNNTIDTIISTSTSTISQSSSPDIVISPNNQQEEEIINIPKTKFQLMKEVCLNCLKASANQKYLVLTPCQHFFHPGCIENWWISKKECPVCRHALPSFDSDFTDFNHDYVNEEDYN